MAGDRTDIMTWTVTMEYFKLLTPRKQFHFYAIHAVLGSNTSSAAVSDFCISLDLLSCCRELFMMSEGWITFTELINITCTHTKYTFSKKHPLSKRYFSNYPWVS